MNIKIYIHPEIGGTFWTTLALRAVMDEIARKRYTAEVLDVKDVRDIDFEAVYAGEEKRLLIYFGHYYSSTPKDLQFLSTQNVHAILLNYESPDFTGNCSKILLNYRDGMRKSVSYLVSAGRDRIALFGVNPGSSTDMLKESFFVEYLREHGGSPARDIYYNYGSIDGCFSRFAENCRDYNAVICANDIAALSLIGRVEKLGLSVPQELYVVSCGGSTLLASRAKLSVTSIAADQHELGRQAVLTYAYLARNPCDIALTVKVGAKLKVRDSTENVPYNNADIFAAPTPTLPNVDFYGDPAVEDIFRAERLLAECDELDDGIIAGIIKGETYPSIAERLYTSENVISYRIKRMCRLANCSKRSELVALLTPYLKQE